MKTLGRLLHFFALTIAFLSVQAQEVKLYSQQPFGSQVPEHYQVVKRTFRNGATANKQVPINMFGNDILAYTSKGASERLVLLLGAKNWLDLTDEVRITGSGVRLSRILGKGVDNRTKPGETAWVKVELLIDPSAEPGVRTIRLLRPSLTGKDESTIRLNLKENIRVHFRSSLVLNGTELGARQAFHEDQEVNFAIYGEDLSLIQRVRDPLHSSIISDLRIVSRFPANFSRSGSISSTSTLTNGTSLSSLGSSNTALNQDRYGLQTISFATKFGSEGKITTQQFYNSLLQLSTNVEVIDFSFAQWSPYFQTNRNSSPSGNHPDRMVLIGAESDSDRGIR